MQGSLLKTPTTLKGWPLAGVAIKAVSALRLAPLLLPMSRLLLPPLLRVVD